MVLEGYEIGTEKIVAGNVVSGAQIDVFFST